MTARPGWYPDPHVPSWERYWDGQHWRAEVDAVRPKTQYRASATRSRDTVDSWIVTILLAIVLLPLFVIWGTVRIFVGGLGVLIRH